jgi:exodeoxyribonuclease VII large subunit
VTIADYVADKRFSTPSAVASGLWPLRADLMQLVDGLEADLARAFARQMDRRETQLSELRRALSWLSPTQRLERLHQGWREAGTRLVAAGGRLLDDRRARLALSLRELTRAFGPLDIAARQAQVQALTERAGLATDSAGREAARRVEVLAARLHGLDPEGPLARGYSLVRIERTGRFLRSASEVRPGDRLGVRTAEGEVAAVVTAEADKGQA